VPELAHQLAATVCKYLTDQPRSMAELTALGIGLSAGATVDESTPVPPAVQVNDPSHPDVITLGTRLLSLAAEGRIEEARLIASRLASMDPHVARAANGVLEALEHPAKPKREQKAKPVAKRIARPLAPPAWLLQAQVDEMTDLAGHPRLKPGTPAHRIMSEGTGPGDADYEETRR